MPRAVQQSIACSIARFLESNGLTVEQPRGNRQIAMAILSYKKEPRDHAVGKREAQSIIRAFSLEVHAHTAAFKKANPRKKRSRTFQFSAVTYSRYIVSGRWYEFRASIVAQRGSTCECCGKVGTVDAHHLTYERLGKEVPEDIKLLCRQCHQNEHPGKVIGARKRRVK